MERGPNGQGQGKYRLRVGEYRLLFTLEKDRIFVHGVKDRKDAYRH
jgi:mRNA-degrading endonuclease RelE of RelBE toxin-antitoxin system